MSVNHQKIIGIVGGVGPFAGLDLARKIFEQTQAKIDQEHLSVALLSMPQEIEDRTAFLLGQKSINPAFTIVRIINKLEQMGACVVGIPCNTVHVPKIFNAIVGGLQDKNSNIHLVHMIDEVSRFIEQHYPNIRNIGLLGTNGICRTQVYSEFLQRKGVVVTMLSESLQEAVHNTIYDGIKAQPKFSRTAVQGELSTAIDSLKREGVEAIILCCTELSLIMTEKMIGKTALIDPTRILAEALIRAVAPEKLKPKGKEVL